MIEKALKNPNTHARWHWPVIYYRGARQELLERYSYGLGSNKRPWRPGNFLHRIRSCVSR